MRNRPLCLVGPVPLKDMHLEFVQEINMCVWKGPDLRWLTVTPSRFINPSAALTVGFFERNLCYDQVNTDGLTTTGIRLGLGDERASSSIRFICTLTSFSLDDPQDDDIIVCGRLSSVGTAKDAKPVLQLVVARIAPKPLPAPPQRRPPRPDDPSPRRPDVFSTLALSRRGTKRLRDDEIQEGAGGGAEKRKKVAGDPKIARAQELMLRPPPPRLELNGKDIDRDGFRVPGAPKQRKEQGATSKSSSSTQSQKPPDPEADSSLLETVNKTVRS